MKNLNIERKLNSFVDKNRKSLIGYIQSLTSATTVGAEDILGDAYEVLSKKMNAGAYPEGLPTCLEATMHDICFFKSLEYLNYRKNLAKKAGVEYISCSSLDDENNASRAADEEATEAHYEANERKQIYTLAMRELLDKLINRLAPQHQAIIRGYYFEDKQLAQIANEIGSTANSVKSTKERLIKKLIEMAKTFDLESEVEAIYKQAA